MAQIINKLSFPPYVPSQKERLEARKNYLNFLKEYIKDCPRGSRENIKQMIKMMKRLVKELES
jgi:uncharacterized FlgJ-related protein